MVGEVFSIPSFVQRAMVGLAINVAFVTLAYRLGTLAKSGAVVACLLGTLVVAAGERPMLLPTAAPRSLARYSRV